MYQERIVNYCIRLSGNREDGDDVAQEVVINAWKYVGGYRFDSPFAHWLIRIATNACRNRYRTQENRRELSTLPIDTSGAEAIVEPPLSGQDLEDEVLRKQYYQHILHIVRETAKTAKPPWDALDWSIFHLLYVEDVAQAREVARRLGKSEDTVKYRIYNRIHPVLERAGERLQAEED